MFTISSASVSVANVRPCVVSDVALSPAGLEIVGCLILGGVGRPGAGEGHARQSAVGRGGEQPEGVPSVPPDVSYPGVLIQDKKRQVVSVKVISGGETRLPATDDDCFDVLAHVGLEANVRESAIVAYREFSQVVSPCCIAKRVAPARVDTPILR